MFSPGEIIPRSNNKITDIGISQCSTMSIVAYKGGYDLKMLTQLKFHYHHCRKMLTNSVKLTHLTEPVLICYIFHMGQALCCVLQWRKGEYDRVTISEIS